MASDIKAVRARIKSVESTRHITKAMGLVASAKIGNATRKMEGAVYYRSVMMEAFSTIANERSIYTSDRRTRLPSLYVVVAGDRGLAGGYNSNIFRSANAMIGQDDVVIPIGRRAIEYYSRRGRCHTADFASVEHFSVEDAACLAKQVRDMYARGEVVAVNIICTRYVSALKQSPNITYVLPLRGRADGATSRHCVIEYEPSAAAVMEAIIPNYIAGILYSAVAESCVAELAARRNAMDTATKNADGMMSELCLRYNRARQSAITQEITEIVAGTNT